MTLPLLLTTELGVFFVAFSVVGFVALDVENVSVFLVLKSEGVVVALWTVVFWGNLKETPFIAVAPSPVEAESEILKMFFEHVDFLVGLFFGVRF